MGKGSKQRADERRAERIANIKVAEAQREEAYVSAMAARLLDSKREAIGAVIGRFAKAHRERSFGELKDDLPKKRDVAMALAFARSSIEAYRAALTLVAIESDLQGGGVERLAAAVMATLPEHVRGQPVARAEKAERFATDAYRLALSEAFGHVDLIASLRVSRASEAFEHVDLMASREETVPTKVGEASEVKSQLELELAGVERLRANGDVIDAQADAMKDEVRAVHESAP